MPFWIRVWILSHWMRDTTGPMVVPSARGSPALRLVGPRSWRWRRLPSSSTAATIIRLGALHDWPELLNMCITPPVTALARSAPSRMDVRRLAAEFLADALDGWGGAFGNDRCRRGWSRVNEIMSILGCSLMAAPTSGPRPLIRLNTPFGTPASWRISAKISADDGVNSLGFRIMVQPAASAGATLQAIWFKGQFHGCDHCR